jgi:large subunit ribosomal protein L21
MATDYAIVETGGKQYRVEKGDSFVVDRLAEEEGAKVSLRAVMFRGESDVVLVPSELEKVKVEAKVAAHERGPKIKVATYKAKKGYRRTKGHRSELTRLEVTDVKLLSRRPTKTKARAEGGDEPAAKAAAGAPTKDKQTAAGDAAAKAKPKAATKPADKAATGGAATVESDEDAVAKRADTAEKAEKPKAKPAAKAPAKPKPKKAATPRPKAETKAGAKPTAAKKDDAKPAAKRKTSSPKKES